MTSTTIRQHYIQVWTDCSSPIDIVINLYLKHWLSDQRILWGWQMQHWQKISRGGCCLHGGRNIVLNSLLCINRSCILSENSLWVWYIRLRRSSLMGRTFHCNRNWQWIEWIRKCIVKHLYLHWAIQSHLSYIINCPMKWIDL